MITLPNSAAPRSSSEPVAYRITRTAAAVGAHSLNRVRTLDQEAPRSRPV